MKTLNRSVLALMLGLVGASGALSQGFVPEAGQPFGNLILPRSQAEEAIEIGILSEDERTTTTTISVSPSLIDTDGAFIWGVQAGIGRNQTTFQVRYLSIGLETPDVDLDQYRFQLIQGLTSKKMMGQGYGLAVVASFSDTKDSSEVTTLFLAGSWSEQTRKKFGLAANLGWTQRESDGGESVDDALATVGASYVLKKKGQANKATVSADYVLENDVAGSDDYSVTFSFSFGGAGTLFVGGGKNDTIFASYKKAFKL